MACFIWASGSSAPSAIANLFAHGSNVWGLIHFPKLDDKRLRGLIAVSHEWRRQSAAGCWRPVTPLVALAHQFVMRDGALARMWPALSRG